MKSVLVMTLLALWLPATNHCRLEQIPGLAFLICCDHETQEQTAEHHKDDCATDSCAVVEDGLYKTENHSIVVVGPALFVTTLQSLLLASSDGLERELSVPPESAPPELSSRWQFAFRAAAPPRAPSVAS